MGYWAIRRRYTEGGDLMTQIAGKVYSGLVERKRWNVFVDVETIRQVKVLAADNCMSIGELVDSLVDAAYRGYRERKVDRN